jgi:hypothetical protein
MPTPILNTEALVIMTNPLQTRATGQTQWQMQWQLEPQVVTTPRSIVSHSHSNHRVGHSDMTPLVFSTGRLLELSMCNRRPFTSANKFETVNHWTRRISKAVAEAPHWQIIGTYCNTSMQQDNIWSLAFEVHTMEILKEVFWSNSQRWLLHTQTSTRF